MARERDSSNLEWVTDLGNNTAQRLYDSTGAKRNEQLGYDLDL